MKERFNTLEVNELEARETAAARCFYRLMKQVLMARIRRRRSFPTNC